MNTTLYANSLFEQPWWLDIVAPGQWDEAFVKDNQGVVLARMPYVRSGRKIVMPKMTQTLGIWMTPEVKHDYGAQKKIIHEIFSTFSGACSVRHVLSPDNRYVLPVRWLGYRIEPCFTYRITDLSDLENLYQSFNKTAKKNIKYAKKKVFISDKTNADTLWTLLNKTFSDQKRKNPMSRDLVECIVQTCEETGHGKYLEAYDSDGNIHSCAYFVYDDQVCYYLMGASDNRFRSSGAQSLILWEGIQFAAKHSRSFDFEGSMVEGIENFFRQFGGTCMPYYCVCKQTLLQECLDAVKPRIKRLIGYKI